MSRGYDWYEKRIKVLETELRDAVVLLALAGPGEDLADKETVELWCTAVGNLLITNNYLIEAGGTSEKTLD